MDFTFLLFGVAMYTLLVFLSVDSEIARTESTYGHCDVTCNDVTKLVQESIRTIITHHFWVV